MDILCVQVCFSPVVFVVQSPSVWLRIRLPI